MKRKRFTLIALLFCILILFSGCQILAPPTIAFTPRNTRLWTMPWFQCQIKSLKTRIVIQCLLLAIEIQKSIIYPPAPVYPRNPIRSISIVLMKPLNRVSRLVASATHPARIPLIKIQKQKAWMLCKNHSIQAFFAFCSFFFTFL